MATANMAIIGMGGFAAQHHNAARALEASGDAKLICTCDPNPDSFAAQQQEWQFAARGVRVYRDYLQMLDAHRHELAFVTIPTPIPLHMPMHRDCIERDLAAYLEKPPTLDYREMQAMLATEERATKQTNVGFNFIIDPLRRRTKERVLAGEFGACRVVSVRALWPRNQAYYRRADWAGRLMLHDQLVLDSPMGNAMAHQVHDVLFWGGLSGPEAYSTLTELQAELYRAHAIQGADTVFVKASTQEGPELRVAMTHACEGQAVNEERVVCERATVSYNIYAQGGRPECRIMHQDGREERVLGEAVELVTNLRAYARYVRGESGRALIRLADCQPFVELNDLAYVSAGAITPVTGEYVRRGGSSADGTETVAIQGISAACDAFTKQGLFPSAQKLAWAGKGGRIATRPHLAELPGVISAMVNAEGR